MPKITWDDIVRKLTSRKFWLALATFVTGILKFEGAGEDTTVQVAALIMSGAAVVAYIIGEGLADASPTITEEHWHVDTGDEEVDVEVE